MQALIAVAAVGATAVIINILNLRLMKTLRIILLPAEVETEK